MNLLLFTTLVILSIYLGVLFTRWRRNRRRMVELAEKLPGPGSSILPLFEIAVLFLYFQQIAKSYKMSSYVLMYSGVFSLTRTFMDKGIARFWLGFKPFVIVFSPETVEPILSNLKVLNKSDEYSAFEPWIGEGLVTSKRDKWQFRRKILTPAFHFRILNDFMPIMNKEATKFVKKLSQPKYLDKRINIVPLGALCTLDTICETAMGADLDILSEAEESPYVKALYELAEMALARISRPWLWSDAAYYRTRFGRRFVRARDSMHEFSMKIIMERKQEWEEILKESENNADGQEKTPISFEKSLELKYAKQANKRLAFLDLLLHQHLVEKNLSLDDVREEVDTFMFAGHDTTAMNINWTLYMLGLYPDIQDKVRAEIDRVFGEDEDDQEFENESYDTDSCQDELNTNGETLEKRLAVSDVTAKHLSELKYLEQVIKEALRMWPSIPFVARQMTEDVKVGAEGEYLIPEGATCMIYTHALHNNPKYYPKPEVFDPDRFSPDATARRHPFAFVPFSAGPRNCIGQKFAQMEVKIILTKLLRNYYFESCEPIDKLHVVGELVLRPTNGLFMRIRPRFL